MSETVHSSLLSKLLSNSYELVFYFKVYIPGSPCNEFY